MAAYFLRYRRMLKQNVLALFSLSVVLVLFIAPRAMADKYTGEIIDYTISPVGRSEYKDWGEVEVEGQKLHYVTFKTKAMGLDDTEHIYSDIRTQLPVKVKRDLSLWLKKERLVENYNQEKFLLTIDKFKAGKKVKEYVFQKDGPIYNAILLPFYLRTVENLEIGWEMKVRFPQEFTVRLSSIEEVNIPAGKFMSYHFTSTPRKFEVWISKDEARLPVKIKGLDGFGYTMVMRKHVLPLTQKGEAQ